MTRISVPGALRRLLWASAVLLTATGCANRPPIAQVPIPAGQARIWFYRTWLPSESLNLANIGMNGVYVGSVENGGAFYRDIAPGTYRIVAESWAYNPETTPGMYTNVAVVPGQEVYIKILDLTSWATSVSGSRTFRRDAFWAWLIPPQQAQAEIAFNRSGI